MWLIACIVPTSGNYVFEVASETTDCPPSFGHGGEPVGTWTVTVTETEVVMALDPDEHCKRDDVRFTCNFASLDGVTDYADRDLDAAITLDVGMTGEWRGSNAIEGDRFAQSVCDGADCEALAAAGIPACLTTWHYYAELQE